MAMVDHFIEFGGYEVKKHDDEENPFAVIEIVETFREIDPEENHGIVESDDLEDEDVIYLDDDFSDEDSADREDETDPRYEAFMIID